jgi:hypothetical protein
MSALNNAAYLDGTGSVDSSGNWQLASLTNPVPVEVISNASTAYITEIDYVSGTNPVYVGMAVPGSALSAAVWQIKKLTYDGNNNVTSVLFAGGSGAFTNIWNNRASYTYS